MAKLELIGFVYFVVVQLLSRSHKESSEMAASAFRDAGSFLKAYGKWLKGLMFVFSPSGNPYTISSA